MKPDPNQYALDFHSRTAEALAALRSLPRHLPQLPIDLAAGVADLLERIALCSRDNTTSHARASKLAAGLDNRRAVSERTVRRWRAAAEQTLTSAGPLLEIDHRSHQHGGHRTNAWRINWPAVRAVLQGEAAATIPAAVDRTAAQPAAPQPGPKARHLAALALSLTEEAAEQLLQLAARQPLQNQAETLEEQPTAGPFGPDRDRTGTGHHDRPKAGHHDRPKGGHHDRPTVTKEKQHPPTLKADRWKEAIETLEAHGLAAAPDLARLAQLRQLEPETWQAEALEALATARAAGPRLRSPAGAAAWKLRTGDWPAGLTLEPPAVVEAQTRARTNQAAAAALERLAYDQLRQARQAVAGGHDPAAVRRRLEQTQPAAVLAQLRATAFWADVLETAGAAAPCP